MIAEITKIINGWDPIDLFPMAPEDEYVREIESLNIIVHDNPEISVDNLAVEIHQLFTKCFGSDVYLREKKECLKVAYEILKLR